MHNIIHLLPVCMYMYLNFFMNYEYLGFGKYLVQNGQTQFNY